MAESASSPRGAQQQQQQQQRDGDGGSSAEPPPLRNHNSGGGGTTGKEGNNAPAAANGTAAAAAAAASSAAVFDLSSFSLFPPTLSPSPHHHSPSHSIITLSAAAPSLVPPSPLLSESPSLPAQPASLEHAHILNDPKLIVNVWASNLQEELAKILHIVDDYPYIAMDTEFPGVVARPGGTARNSSDYQYQLLKTNCDMLKIIQLGLCFCDAEGRIHPGTCTWQFNFSFSLSTDMYAQDSIDLLSKSGIDFAAHEKNGISPQDFGEWLLTSGIVLNEEVKWISFHSGFDFGYLLKILTASPLPSKEDDFFAQLQLYFPCIYDIKVLMESCQNLHGGLSKIAELLNVMRIGPQHQAGSDSLLTAATFFKMRQAYFAADGTNPLRWGETMAHRNAVRREQRLPSTAALAQQLAAQPGPPPYSVLTNTDQLSAFDHKFLGVLYGLNNDYTEAWKRKAEREKKRRMKREADMAAGLPVEDSDDEEDWLQEVHSHARHTSVQLHGKSSGSSSSSNTTASSPSFRPQQSYGNPPSHLVMTPTKPSQHGHSNSAYYASPQHGDYGHGKGVTKHHTPLHAQHRSRYSIDNS